MPNTSGKPAGAARLFCLALIVCAAAGAVCVGLDLYGRGARRAGPVHAVGVEPVAPTTVSSPEEAYRFWKERGYHGRTVLYVAGGWDRFNPADFLEDDPRHIYPLPLFRSVDRIEEKYLDSTTFLYLASLRGIARRLIAVVPAETFAQAREGARRAKNARVTEDSVYITHQGFPRWFGMLSAIPQPGEPVLLYVGASAFRTAAPAELLAALENRGIKADAVVLCTMDRDPGVTPREREALAEFRRLLEGGGR